MKTLEKYYDELGRWTHLHSIEPIDITGAAKWYFEGSDRDEWSVNDDFPSLTPPFPLTWVEYGNIHRVRHGNIVEPITSKEWRAGAMLVSIPIREEASANVLRGNRIGIALSGLLNGPYVSPGGDYVAAITAAADGGQLPRWGLAVVLYEDSFLFGNGLHRIGGTYLYLDERGDPLDLPVVPLVVAGPMERLRHTEHAPDLPDLMMMYVYPVLFALSLMNAKNVSIVDAPPLPPAVAKKRERKGQPVLKFKTLHIEPMRARVKREKQEGQSEVKLALHLCRGHFKDYRDSGGLFGKYKGLYWWDSHVRGTEEAGRVIKDYELGKPKGA